MSSKFLTNFIYLIVFVKVLYAALSIGNIYLKSHHGKKGQIEQLVKIEHWRSRVEFVFVTLMAILLIYLFNPYQDNISQINYETKLMLYLFGIILLITAKWDTFITESKVFQELQQVLGGHQ